MLSALSNRLKQSISLRIAAVFCGTFAVSIILAFVVTFLEVSFSLEGAAKEVIDAKLRETTSLLSSSGIPGLQKFHADPENRALNAPFLIRVVSGTGTSLFLKPSVQKEKFDFEELLQNSSPAKRKGWHSFAAIDDEDIFDILTVKVEEGSYVQIGRSSEERYGVLETIAGKFLASAIALIAISTLLGVLFLKRSLRPIGELVTIIREIEGGNLSRRVPLGKNRDELWALGETFNHMVERIERLIRMMGESIDNLAHEIRTPLTRVRGTAEQALLSPTSEPLREALADCAENVTGLSEMVDQLLSISEAEAGTAQVQASETDVAVLLKEVLEVYEFVAQEKSVVIDLEVTEEARLWRLDRKKAKQAVGNFLDNALKFSPFGGTITVKAFKVELGLRISVTDEGTGVHPIDLPRIWDRLYRAEKSRTTKGNGLGLAIVKAVALAHGGSVDAENLPKGAAFWIVFPPREQKK